MRQKKIGFFKILDQNTPLRGSPHQSASKIDFFLLLQSLELLSENILAKFQSPTQSSL